MQIKVWPKIRGQKVRYLILGVIIIFLAYCIYSAVWYFSYPTKAWKTYSNKEVGVRFRYPADFTIVESPTKYNKQEFYISDNKIKNPRQKSADENLAYKEDAPCDHAKRGGWLCGSIVILNGFFLDVRKSKFTKYEGYPYAYKKAVAYRSKTVNINGTEGYKQANYVWYPGAWAIGQDVGIIFFRADSTVAFDASYPVNQQMYSRLLDKILSTLEFID